MADHRWLSILKEEIGKSPLALNTVIGLVLLGLEKMTELEFQCPCNPYRNAWFSSAFFVIPAMMSIIMMLIANNFRCASGKCLEQCGKLMSCVTPAVVWLTLLFFDGKYYTCAATSWEGEYVNVYSGAPLKWCKPLQVNETEMEQRRLLFKDSLFWSQVAGLILLGLIFLGLGLYQFYQCCKKG
nr:calcium homeostasis modulator protein 4-like [Paramormyrops kingsleyae]